MPAQTVRFLPTAIIYAANTGMASAVFLSSYAFFSTPTPVYSRTTMLDTAARINAAITEVNTYPQSYGYATSPALPQLPSVPTGGNALFYQSDPKGAALSQSLVDPGQTSGGSTPLQALDLILAEPALGNIKLARANLDAGRS